MLEETTEVSFHRHNTAILGLKFGSEMYLSKYL